MIVTILEVAFVRVTIGPKQSTKAVKVVRLETARVDSFLARLWEEDQFALSGHLRVGKLTDIVATIWPAELTVTIYVAFFQATSEDVGELALHSINRHRLGPLLDALSTDLILVEDACYFNSSVQHLQTASSTHLRLGPVTFVFSVVLSISNPLELAFSVELPRHETSVVV